MEGFTVQGNLFESRAGFMYLQESFRVLEVKQKNQNEDKNKADSHKLRAHLNDDILE